jgi:hypothetical protein
MAASNFGDLSAQPATVSDGPRSWQGRRMIFIFFAMQILALTIFQKIGFPIAVALPIFFLGISMLVTFGPISLGPIRLILYSAFSAAIIMSQLFGVIDFSPSAMLLLMVLYMPIVINVVVPKDAFLGGVDLFQKIMLFIFAVVLYERVSQVLFSYKAWPNLNELLPRSILIPEYNYLRETGWQTGIYQPNGVFFLEPSIVSQFFALALIMEIVWFKKLWRMALFALGMLLSQAGTGFVVLGLTSPLLLKHLPPRLLPAIIAGVIAVTAVGIWSGVAPSMFNRTAEFSQSGSSGRQRFVDPLIRMSNRIASSDSFYTGIGAGNTVTGRAGIEFPFSKLFLEYGLLATALFYAMFLFALFESPPSRTVAWAFLMFHTFGGGGLSVPVYAITTMLFCTIISFPSEEGVSTVRRTISGGGLLQWNRTNAGPQMRA